MIKELRNKIIKANELYRIGKSVISDAAYDLLIEELSLLSPDDELLFKVGHTITDDRKSPLPIEMASMNKIKTIDDINDWCRLKSIPKKEMVIITPKFDGLSLCVDEETDECWTRGDGINGQKSDDHYVHIGNHLSKPLDEVSILYTYGEVMMPKKTFLDKYSNDFANPRNFVGGLINSKTIDGGLISSLKDCNYIKYGAVCDGLETKQEIIDELNHGQKVKVQYHMCKMSDLTEDLLVDLFHKWSVDYEIDGVIIEINDLELQEKLGRETSSNNPVYARAFKHESFEQTSETEVIGITWNISKQGYLKPVLHVDPIKLDGVTVSNVTGNNARFIKDMGLGVGARVIIKRSGMVIPLIVDVLETVEWEMPEGDIEWNENGVELITTTETDEQRLKKIISFFSILEADNVGEGVITQFWDAGYQTVEDILNLTISDMMEIDRFGKRKSEIVYNSIKSCVTDVSLSKLQHASGIFNGLGSKKLILLEHFTTKPSVDEVMEIEGFAEKSASVYVDNYDRFFEFIKDLPITIEEQIEVELADDDLIEMNVVFTGVRRADLEDTILSRGGKVSGSVSKNTTHLVMKAVGSGSSKEVKATQLGVKILTVEQLEKFLN